MKKNQILVASLFFLLSLTISCLEDKKANNNSDTAQMVVYGGTSAGVSAAIQSSRMGKSVILIVPSGRIGGLTTGGLGQTDIGKKDAIGGIAREFYQNIRTYYDQDDNWNWQQKDDYRDGGQTKTSLTEDAMWTFEPSAALEVLTGMLDKADVKVYYNEKLNRKTGIKTENKKIKSITMHSGLEISASVFIDATYEGDLMAMAGVSYTVGRESNDTYGENLNGVQPLDTTRSLTGQFSKNAINHNFVANVDPYVIEGDSSSRLLPFIDENPLEAEGSGDNKVQAYCFRMCLTDHEMNKVPFSKPEGYDSITYELLLRNFEAGYNSIPWINSAMPNRKTDTNNGGGFSTDFIGQNYEYPEADYETREEIVEAHLKYQQGLMWTLANNPRVPESVRNEVSRWGTCKDEFIDSNGWPAQLYIREARRMVGSYVMTQLNCELLEIVDDVVGLAAYGMDSHNVQRYVTENGYVRNEGNVEAHVEYSFPISYRSILPKSNECSNLLVPVCLSASHIAFGSIRMEPVFMVLGQSAATAGALAIDKGIDMHELDYNLLREQLVKDKQRLNY